MAGKSLCSAGRLKSEKAADWIGGSHDIEDQEVFLLMDKKTYRRAMR